MSDERDRLATGIQGLDEVLGGGLIRGGIFLVMGRPGAGKTILGNQLCFNHVAQGGRALYMTLLAESHATLLANVETFDFFEPQAVSSTLKYLSGYKPFGADNLEGVRQTLGQAIREHKPSLLVIDGFLTAGALAGRQWVSLK